MVRSYVPQEQELAKRLADPRIRLAEVKAGSELYRFASLRASHHNAYLDSMEDIIILSITNLTM